MKYNIYEILGVAGSGKSTIINILAQEKDKYTFILEKKDICFLNLKYSFTYLKIYFLTKNINLIKLYMMYHIFLNQLKNNKLDNTDTYIFDQGPIFIISMLIYEVPSMKNFFLKELNPILKYYNGIVYLEAPLEVLISRITRRKQKHRIKKKSKTEQLNFLNAHMIIYNEVIDYCSTIGVPIRRIDTNINSIDKVKEKVYEII